MTSYSVLMHMGELPVGVTPQFRIGLSLVPDWLQNNLYSDSSLHSCPPGTHLVYHLHLSTFFVARLPLLSFWIPTLFCNLTSVTIGVSISKSLNSIFGFHLMTNTTLHSVYRSHLASGNVYIAQLLLNFIHFNQLLTLLPTNTT